MLLLPPSMLITAFKYGSAPILFKEGACSSNLTTLSQEQLPSHSPGQALGVLGNDRF